MGFQEPNQSTNQAACHCRRKTDNHQKHRRRHLAVQFKGQRNGSHGAHIELALCADIEQVGLKGKCKCQRSEYKGRCL